MNIHCDQCAKTYGATSVCPVCYLQLKKKVKRLKTLIEHTILLLGRDESTKKSVRVALKNQMSNPLVYMCSNVKCEQVVSVDHVHEVRKCPKCGSNWNRAADPRELDWD